eukprot:2280812-Rhodomonas_salina.1
MCVSSGHWAGITEGMLPRIGGRSTESRCILTACGILAPQIAKQMCWMTTIVGKIPHPNPQTLACQWKVIALSPCRIHAAVTYDPSELRIAWP